MTEVMQILAAFTGTIAFSVLFSVPTVHCLLCGITGGFGWGIYLWAARTFHSPTAATFLATLFLTMLSRYLSVKKKTPTTVFLLCGIFTLVPGAGIYYTAYYAVMGDVAMTLFKGMETVKLAMAIVLGIGVAYSIPAKIFGWKKKAKIWNEER